MVSPYTGEEVSLIPKGTPERVVEGYPLVCIAPVA